MPSQVRAEINVTPLVDVCLVLLIIFMVVTPLIEAGLLELAEAPSPEPWPAETVRSRVTLAFGASRRDLRGRRSRPALAGRTRGAPPSAARGEPPARDRAPRRPPPPLRRGQARVADDTGRRAPVRRPRRGAAFSGGTAMIGNAS